MYMLFEFAVPYPAEGLSRVMRERTHIGVAVPRRAGQGQPDCINGRLLHSNSQGRGTAVSRPISLKFAACLRIPSTTRSESSSSLFGLVSSSECGICSPPTRSCLARRRAKRRREPPACARFHRDLRSAPDLRMDLGAAARDEAPRRPVVRRPGLRRVARR
jgi:hypothetical protein